MNASIRIILAGLFLLAPSLAAGAAIPLILNHQGFVKVNDVPLTGPGTFKFGIIDASGTYVWTNDGSKVGQAAGLLVTPNIPTNGVAVFVSSGQYSVRLGDTAVVNMAALPSSTFDGDSAILRIFFDDGTNGEVAIGDEPITSTPYSFHASLADTASFAQTSPGALDGGVIRLASIDPANDLTIGSTRCADSSNLYAMQASQLTKRVDSTWAAGNNAGGFDSGSVGASPLIIYIWAIGDSTASAVPDYLFSADGQTPTLPSGYDIKRLLGGRLWNGSAWEPFITTGKGRSKRVTYLTMQQAINGSSLTFIDVDVSAMVPTITSREIRVNFDVTDVGVSATASVHIRPNGSNASINDSYFGRVWTNNSGEGRLRANGFITLDENGIFEFATLGNASVLGSIFIQGFLEEL